MFWLWALLAMLLQQPLVAAIVVLGLWFIVDRARFQRTGPIRWFRKRGAIAKLRTTIEVNPHDRDARFRLAQMLVETGAHAEALALVEKNLAAGDSDDETLFVAGCAAFGLGGDANVDKAEEYMARAREKSSSFRSAAIELELGRGRLSVARYSEAQQALDAAIKAQPGSVEAHVLLARALAGLGKPDAAAAAKRRAWQLYLESPRFRRRQTRTWAWRANPAAAVRYVAAVVAVVIAIVVVVPKLLPTIPDYSDDGYYYDGEYYVDDYLPVDGFNVDTTHVPAASRFEVGVSATVPDHGLALNRWDLNENNIVDMARKATPGDAICRLVMHYPELASHQGSFVFAIRDTQSDAVFSFGPMALVYYATPESRDSVFAFEGLLESVPPKDCTFAAPGDRLQYGIRNGVPFGE